MVKVGFRTAMLLDAERSNWNNRDPRPVYWSAWYPASEGASLSETLTGPVPALFVRQEVCDAAPAMCGQSCPVVLLSHGTGGAVGGMSWLAHRLALAGYIVIGVDHHGNTAREPYCAEGFLCWWERARDLSFALDYHLSEGPFASVADPDRVHAAGFSLGGYTVAATLGAITDLSRFLVWAKDMPFGRGPREFPDIVDRIAELKGESRAFRLSFERQGASYLDTRIKSAFLCAPAPTVRAFTEDSLLDIARPVAITVGKADREAPAVHCAEWLAARLSRSELMLLGDLVGHYVFIDPCTPLGQLEEPEICIDAPGADRRKLHEVVAAHAIQFFTGHA